MNIRQYLRNKRIGVLYGGRSTERGISLLSGKAVLKSLQEMGFDAVGIDAGPNTAAELKKQKVDLAYIALHGPWGEDGTMQGLLEIMGIPYSGCGVLASALAMNKTFTKRVLDAEGLPTAKWFVAEKGGKKTVPPRFPVVVKPPSQGSAIGVSIARTAKEYERALRASFTYEPTALVEAYIPGTEVTVGVLGDRALPVVEIVPDGAFYDFTSKYQPGKSRHLIPPRLERGVVKKIESLALKTFRALGCRAVARVDMIVDGKGRPWILEVNTIPGMTETSLLPDEARAAGIGFGELILKIIEYSLN
jgi:D-alanine--D-alanine ligase